MRLPILAAAAFAASCAHLPATSAVLLEERGLSDYVQARHASAAGDLGRAALLYEGALGHAPSEPYLLKSTMELAIAAGDEDLAVGAARRLAEAGAADSATGLILAADALKRRRWGEFDARLDTLTSSGFGSFVAPVVRAWGLEARGKPEEARAALDGKPPRDFAPQYWLEHRGHLAMVQGRKADAIAAYLELLEASEGGESGGGAGSDWRARLLLADAYRTAGRKDYALEVLEDAEDRPDVFAARQALSRGKKIDEAPGSAREAVAALFIRLAADLSRDRTAPIALLFARTATWLDPDDSRGWLLTSQFLARAEQFGSALAAAQQIDEKDDDAAIARGQTAALLSALDRQQEALALLEAAAAAKEAGAEAFVQLGEAYSEAERHGDAIAAYRAALERPLPSEVMRWQIWFLIGAAEEQRGDWQSAETALRKALQLSPEEAVTLNYLGYTLLDHGVKTEEAIQLIEEAHRLRPNDGHITDSLGWAQYRQGDYAEAVETLERAIADVPGDTTINDHLGDAYWQVGRRIEARFRWRAALDGEPTEAQREIIERKLAYGYDRALAASTPPEERSARP